MTKSNKILLILAQIQQRLRVPKTQSSKNNQGRELFKFRDYPQILETLKPLLKEFNCLIYSQSEIVEFTGRFYVKATVSLVDVTNPENEISASAYAREETLVGMNPPQSTGSAESYALKRAAAGLFAIDDGTKDPDTTSEGMDWLHKFDKDLWDAACALNKVKTKEEIEEITSKYAYLSESRLFLLFVSRAEERIQQNQSNNQNNK